MTSPVKTLDPTEELISDRFWDVQDPLDKPYYVVSCQNALRAAPVDNSEFHEKLFNTATHSTLHPLPNCPEFVSLCAQYFSVSESIISNSRGDAAICKIDSQSMIETLNYPADFLAKSISFDEAEIIQIYKKATKEEKDQLYQKILVKPDENLMAPFSSELCLPVIIPTVTLLNQVLGSDTFSVVNESILGIFLYLNRPGTAPLRFDEYLAKEICFQLSEFGKIYHFRYQAYLFALVIHAKREALSLIDPGIFGKLPPPVPFYHTWSYSDFIDLIVLSLFRLFDPEISRISTDLREILNPDLEGNWFLARNYSLIRVFGFTGAPYVLPIFLTTSVFSLEVMRQKLLADKEHFTAPSLKRSAWIKYPLSVGNFILKKETALPIIEQILQQLDFPHASPANYDPKHIISERRLEYRRTTFQHVQLTAEKGMGEANSLMFDKIWHSEPLKQIVEERGLMDFAQSDTAHNQEKKKLAKKRLEPDTVDMDIEKQETSKKQKTTEDTEIIDVDLIKEIIVSPTMIPEEIPEEVPLTMSESSASNPQQSSKPPLVQIMQYKRYNYDTASEGQFQNKQSLLEHYMEQRKESLRQEHKKFNELKKSEGKVTLMSARDSATGALNLAVTDDNKASEIRLEMDHLPASDKIWFHKQASEILYADLTKETLAHKNALQKIEKLEAHLKQEKAVNKAWATQLAHSQSELAAFKGTPSEAGAETQPGTKATAVKPVKRRGKAVNVSVDTVPSPILITLNGEIAELKAKVVENNAKVLVLQEQKSALELEKGKLIQEVEQLKSNTAMNPWSPVDQITHEIADLTVHEVEVGKYKEKVSELEDQIAELKKQIQESKDQDSREEEIVKLKDENDKLSSKVHKLKQKITGVLPLEGAKHLLWDELMADINAFRPQLMIAEQHNKALVTASNKCKLAEEKLMHKTQQTAQNAINYLSRASSSELQILKVRNRTASLVDARKVLQKYNLMNAVREKRSQIKDQVQIFKQTILPLFGYGLPPFWDNEDKLIAESEYKELLIKARSDDSKFNDMVKGLKGVTVIRKMRQDFELPLLFREVKAKLPVFTEVPLIELEVLMKELSNASVPKDDDWKEVSRVGSQVIKSGPGAASSSGK